MESARAANSSAPSPRAPGKPGSRLILRWGRRAHRVRGNGLASSLSGYALDGDGMALSPLAGKPAPKETAGRSRRGWNATIWSAGRIRTIPPSRSASGPAGTADHPCAARSPRRTSWRSPRRSATIATRRPSPARSTWARTRTRSRGPRSGPRSRCWRPTTWRPSSSATTASRRRRRSPTPSSSITAGAMTGWPTASSSRPRTIRRRTAASSTTRPTAGRPTPMSPGGSRIEPTRCCATAMRA